MIIDILFLVYSDTIFNWNKVNIKYQSCPKSRKIHTFGQEICICHNTANTSHKKTVLSFKDIESFLAGSTPVVYMSLGSVVRSESMPEELKKIFLKAFQQLPYKILWKYEDESFKGLPDNVMIKKWMPQQDILGTITLA